MGVDEGAAPLMADHQVFPRHFVERAAHRALGHAEAGGEFLFGRQGIGHRIAALGDLAQQGFAHLAVQRSIAGTGPVPPGFRHARPFRQKNANSSIRVI